jgi:2-methylaconitate cis-trans-isomerase PrpF
MRRRAEENLWMLRGKFDDVIVGDIQMRVRFIEPAGGATGKFLPTGNALDHVDGTPISCVDFANPVVMVAASALGKTGYETKQELDADTPWLAQLEALRMRAAQQMNMGDVVGKGLPKVVMLAPSRDGGTIASRYFSPEKCHTTHALTGAVCVAVLVRENASHSHR